MSRLLSSILPLALAAAAAAQAGDTAHRDTAARADSAARRDTAVPAPAATTDTVFLRVQQLAANGQGDAARALVQQALESAPTASPKFVEALYWRAVVASTAADAERDLRTIIVDYPLSPQSADALMRLAQLEMTRGETDQALTHLQRLITEHPDSPQRARAGFWIARVEFQQGQSAAACRQLADADRTAPAGDVELKNQIEYWSGRCVGVDTVAARADSGAAKGAAAKGAAAGTAAGARPGAPPPPPPAPAAKRQWTVQVGAYNTRPAADALVKTLKGKGYDARVFGEIAPFRVRIGRYPTRAKADSAAQKLNAKKITGFVTEAEPQ